MKRKVSNWMFALVAVLSLGAISCGTVAHIEKDETVNFNTLRTFTWDSEKSLKDRNSNSLIDSKLRDAVNKELIKNGWREVKSNADVILDYNIMVENSVRESSNPVYSRPFTRYFYNPYTRRINGFWYPSQMLGFERTEIPYREGTVTLHMIDRKSNKLIWQGWTSDQVNSSNLTSKEINSSVRSIMRKFNVS